MLSSTSYNMVKIPKSEITRLGAQTAWPAYYEYSCSQSPDSGFQGPALSISALRPSNQLYPKATTECLYCLVANKSPILAICGSELEKRWHTFGCLTVHVCCSMSWRRLGSIGFLGRGMQELSLSEEAEERKARIGRHIGAFSAVTCTKALSLVF